MIDAKLQASNVLHLLKVTFSADTKWKVCSGSNAKPTAKMSVHYVVLDSLSR